MAALYAKCRTVADQLRPEDGAARIGEAAMADCCPKAPHERPTGGGGELPDEKATG